MDNHATTILTFCSKYINTVANKCRAHQIYDEMAALKTNELSIKRKCILPF